MAKALRLKHHRGTRGVVSEALRTSIDPGAHGRGLARLAYVAEDGTPRVVPIVAAWNGTEVVMCTTTIGPDAASLRRNPAVALTIDVEAHPPRALLLRGEAALDDVAGNPDECLRIVVRPTWAELIDVEEAAPGAVGQPGRRRRERREP